MTQQKRDRIKSLLNGRHPDEVSDQLERNWLVRMVCGNKMYVRIDRHIRTMQAQGKL